MAYFSNGSEGAVFDHQCSKGKFGQKACPIYWVQANYNYNAVNNKTATDILGHLVKDDGTCTVWEMAKEDFGIDPDQLKMFG